MATEIETFAAIIVREQSAGQHAVKRETKSREIYNSTRSETIRFISHVKLRVLVPSCVSMCVWGREKDSSAVDGVQVKIKESSTALFLRYAHVCWYRRKLYIFLWPQKWSSSCSFLFEIVHRPAEKLLIFICQFFFQCFAHFRPFINKIKL